MLSFTLRACLNSALCEISAVVVVLAQAIATVMFFFGGTKVAIQHYRLGCVQKLLLCTFASCGAGIPREASVVLEGDQGNWISIRDYRICKAPKMVRLQTWMKRDIYIERVVATVFFVLAPGRLHRYWRSRSYERSVDLTPQITQSLDYVTAKVLTLVGVVKMAGFMPRNAHE